MIAKICFQIFNASENIINFYMSVYYILCVYLLIFYNNYLISSCHRFKDNIRQEKEE